jgi:DNA repair exonuclease SbcCD ATPase subunit
MNLRELQASIANIIGKRAEAVDRLNRLTTVEDRFNPENITAINAFKQAIATLSEELTRLERERAELLEVESAARREYVAALNAYDEIYGRFPNAEKEAGELLKRYAKITEAAEKARSIVLEKMNALTAVAGGFLPLPPAPSHAWRTYAKDYAFEIEHRGGD